MNLQWRRRGASKNERTENKIRAAGRRGGEEERDEEKVQRDGRCSQFARQADRGGAEQSGAERGRAKRPAEPRSGTAPAAPAAPAAPRCAALFYCPRQHRPAASFTDHRAGLDLVQGRGKKRRRKGKILSARATFPFPAFLRGPELPAAAGLWMAAERGSLGAAQTVPTQATSPRCPALERRIPRGTRGAGSGGEWRGGVSPTPPRPATPQRSGKGR